MTLMVLGITSLSDILQKNLLVEICLFLVSRLSHRLREGRPPEGPAVGVSVTVDTIQGLLASGSGQVAPELFPLGFDTVLVEESRYVRPTLGLWKYMLHTQASGCINTAVHMKDVSVLCWSSLRQYFIPGLLVLVSQLGLLKPCS